MNIPPMSFARQQKEFRAAINTTNVDAQDNYTEVHALFESAKPIETLIESVAVQAVPTVVHQPIQCTIGESRNMDTQFEPQLFSQERLSQIIQSKEYNAFIQDAVQHLSPNLLSNHVGDAEFALSKDQEDYDAKSQSNLSEIQSFQHKYSKNKSVTCFKTIKYQKLTLVFQALAPIGFTGANTQQYVQDAQETQEYDPNEQMYKFVTLVWNIADNMQPLAYLIQPAACTSLDVIDNKGSLVVVMGTFSGQVLLYDLDGCYRDLVQPVLSKQGDAVYNSQNQITLNKILEQNTYNTIFLPSLQTAPASFHTLPVTDVKWLPQNSQITQLGELQASANRFGTIQFASVSPDGYIKVYRLDLVDRDPARADLAVLKPFLSLPAATIYPQVRPVKPLTIQFTATDVPSSLVLVGDCFGRLCVTTWSAAVAGYYALDSERKRLEKQYMREMNEQTQANIASLTCFATDFPTKGTLVVGFQYFQTGIFQIQFSEANHQLLLVAAQDSVKLLAVDRKLHRQSTQYALRGLVEEQAIFDFGKNCRDAVNKEELTNRPSEPTPEGTPDPMQNFCIVDDLPENKRPFEVDDKPQDQNQQQTIQLMRQDEKTGLHKKITTLQETFLNPTNLVQNLLLNPLDINNPQKKGGLAATMFKCFEDDFPNYDFYEPVFEYCGQNGHSFTASCLSATRQAVLYIGTDRGAVLVFDLNDRMYEPLIQANVCVGTPITKLEYVQEASMSAVGGGAAAGAAGAEGGYSLLPEKRRVRTKDVLLAGDAAGNVHVLEIPKSLRFRRDKDRGLRERFRRNLQTSEYLGYRGALRGRKQEELAAEAERRRQEEKEAAMAGAG